MCVWRGEIEVGSLKVSLVCLCVCVCVYMCVCMDVCVYVLKANVWV